MTTNGTTTGPTIEKVDYFENHELVIKWPFTIYHRPIERSLASCIDKVRAENKGILNVLVFGCGLFHEYKLFPKGTRFHLIDQDERLHLHMKSFITTHQDSHFNVIQDLQILEERLNQFQSSYDLVMSKEVIEHLSDAPRYLRLFNKILRPNGLIWLSTPNYGYWTLPFLEATILEIIARRRGFSRKELHPNKYDQIKLLKELNEANFSEVTIGITPWKFALVANGRKNPN